jgi:hypothetical protein
MGPLDAFGHVLNLFLPGLALGAVTAALAKLAWRRELAAVRWRGLALWSGCVCALVALGGLVLLGRDGRIATYAAMVLACAVTLWWRGFGPGRR